MIAVIPFEHLLLKVIDNRGKTCPVSDSGIPLIATNCIKNGTLYPVFEKIRHVSNETYRTWFRGHPRPGDIILVTKGSPGQVCLAPDPVNFCIAQDMVAVRADPDRIYPPYLFAALRSDSIQSQIANMHVGTLIPHFKKGDFDKLKIPVPSMESQRLIGDVYLRLSKKIDLNRRMNETLEAMARATFKDWFVDFGPTRAKMEGRPSYLSADVWSLFPDRLDDEGKPEGWKFEALFDHANLMSGGTPKTEEPAYWNGSIAWASAKDVSQCSDNFLIDTERAITERGLTESSTRLIPQFATVVVARGATTGRFRMFGRQMAMNQTCYALTSRYDRPFWLNCLFETLVRQLLSAAHGSVFDTITTNTLAATKCLHPRSELLDRFEATVRPIFGQILHNVEECGTLAVTRDLVLPKLMSGELSVQDVPADMVAA